MYAVFLSGGKQHRVQMGDVVKLEKLEHGVGDQVEFTQVLMVAEGEAIQLGAPYLASVKIMGEVIEHGRHKKIRILKFRRRKHHMKRMGHRQYYTAIKITQILAA